MKCPDLLKTDPAVDGTTWNWTVSGGSIASGQGTAQIIIEAAVEKEVTATVDVGGLPAGCSLTGSKAITIQ